MHFMVERNWSTTGKIPGREPEGSLYDLDYYKGNRASEGVQFPVNGSYLNPESEYQNKFKDMLGWITEHVGSGSILDVGCGPAHLTHWANKLNLPLSIMSCDISHAILNWTLGHNGAIATQCDGCLLPFKSRSFDGVLFADVLEHMWPQSALQAVKEAGRLLSSSGYIFVNIPNRITWSSAARKDKGHVWLPTIREMKELLLATGFETESIEYYTRGFPLSKALRRVTDEDFKLPFLGRSIFISAQKN